MIPLEEIAFQNKDLSPEMKKMKETSDRFFKKISSCINFLGPILAFTILLFYSILTHTFFRIIIPFWKGVYGENFSVFLKVLGAHFSISWIFNYTLTMTMKAGSTKDFHNSIYYRKNDPLIIPNDVLDIKSIFKNKLNISSINDIKSEIINIKINKKSYDFPEESLNKLKEDEIIHILEKKDYTFDKKSIAPFQNLSCDDNIDFILNHDFK